MSSGDAMRVPRTGSRKRFRLLVVGDLGRRKRPGRRSTLGSQPSIMDVSRVMTASIYVMLLATIAPTHSHFSTISQ